MFNEGTVESRKSRIAKPRLHNSGTQIGWKKVSNLKCLKLHCKLSNKASLVVQCLEEQVIWTDKMGIFLCHLTDSKKGHVPQMVGFCL